MSRERFEAAYSETWEALETQLKLLEHGQLEIALESFPANYRQLCQHLALVRSRGYGADLENRLNQLALRGHQQLYRGRPSGLRGAARLLAVTFPQRVRAEARLFWISAVLLFLPGLVMNLAVTIEPDLAFSMMSQSEAEGIGEMYADAESVLEEREADSDFLMFGFYIWNNVSIAFRTFAGGVIAGIGTIFFLVFNGLFLGTVSGYLQNLGLQHTFYPFVIGHGSFELIAIVLAGAAGLRLGSALLMPGSLPRAEALKRAAHHMLPVIFGTAVFLFIAAFIEAYWSPRPTAPEVRYWVGAALWVLVAGFLLLAGRTRRRA